ncbi:MAG: AAA family ATPase [SAR324 cluster bacterium]|nr:AAA family ATPase [SAR324 cluster bacterium]
MGDLQQKLLEVGYRLTGELEKQVVSALHTRPCPGSFLTGPAGAGKTFLAEAVAQVQGRNTFFFQAFPGCRKEELFQTILPDADQPSGFRTLAGVLPQAAQASQHGATALILDEWDKTHPSTDAFLLDFLQTGRISVPGSQVRARQENLVVFVTLNDERELSEPLLRRLPLIELRPPPAALVVQALQDTHADHRFLRAAVTLYRRSLLVNLSKPVTIQELRQLLDAISQQGPEADWNRLVFQFVTKNWDDHELLKSSETLPLDSDYEGLGQEKPVLSAEQYDGEEIPTAGEDGGVPSMPRVQREWLEKIPSREVEAQSHQVYGVVPRSESGYDGVARALLDRHRPEAGGSELSIDDPSDLRIAQVGDTEIIVFEALDFERIEGWGLILRDGGELLLEARHGGEVTPQLLQRFRTGALAEQSEDTERCRIYSLTDREVLMRYGSIKIRWTPELLEVVTRELKPTREFWEFLYGAAGVVTMERSAQQAPSAPQTPAEASASDEQLGEDYLRVLRDYRHLRQWFALLIKRNLMVWGRLTCEFLNKTVTGSILPAAGFSPENENPSSKEEAESIAVFNSFTQPALDYYESNLTLVESELTLFVAKSGELPPAVEDGGIFSLYEVHSDLDKIKKEGLKLYMRKAVREA